VLATEGTGRTEIRAGVLIIDGDLLNSSNYRPELPGFGTELRTHSALFDSDGNIVSLERNSSDGVMVSHEQP
jgi:hypothetical protein